MGIGGIGRVAAAASLLAVVGCGTDAPAMPPDASGPRTPVTAGTQPGSDEPLAAFNFDPLEGVTGVDDLAEGGEPQGRLLPAAEPSERQVMNVEAAGNFTDEFDPCTLVTRDEWTAWAGSGGQGHIPLEHREVCGFINGDDTIRMAIGWIPHHGGDRLLSPMHRGSAAQSPVLGHAGYWLPGWPVPQSSMLVVGLDDGDLGIEMSSLGDVADRDLLEAARDFAELALGRLP